MSTKKTLNTYQVTPNWDDADSETVEALTPEEAVKKVAVSFNSDPEDAFEVSINVKLGTYKAKPNYEVTKLPDTKT